jgi:TfoX/Sxy family transcriptional regulator of competence genes
MFGGVTFLVNGNMCCGVERNNLVLRLGADAEAALAQAHARPMDFTGKPLRGMVYVDPAGYASNKKLGTWIERAVRCAAALPPKKKGN